MFDQLEEISNYMHENHIGEDYHIDEQYTQLPYDEMNASKLRIKKYACWNCYKLLERDFIQIEDKEFCS